MERADSSPVESSGPWRNRHLRRDLWICTTDGAAYTVMVGIAEIYFAAFVLRLGLGQIAAGLIATVPMLLGAVFQTLAPRLLIRCGSYRKFVTRCAAIQAAAMLPLVFIALIAPFQIPALQQHGLTWLVTAAVFLATTVYFAAGLSTAPAWTTLTGILIPRPIRAGYFARRTRLLQIYMVGAIVLHGLIMLVADRFHPDTKAFTPHQIDPTLVAFAVVFAIGSGARFLSAYYLAQYSEGPDQPHDERPMSFRAYVGRFRHAEDGKYLAAMLAMHVASQIAQPYFNPFMIKLLRLDTTPMLEGMNFLPSAYTWLLAAAYVGRVLILPIAGRLAHRSGVGMVLIVGTVLLIPMPLFWLVTTNVWLLFVGQILSGMAWACWELGGALLLYDKVPARERTAIVTHQTLCNEFCKTSGSMIGAGGLKLFGDASHGYAIVFWGSTAARIAAALLLLRVRRPATTTAAPQALPVSEA